jgi:hypothetical protein
MAAPVPEIMLTPLCNISAITDIWSCCHGIVAFMFVGSCLAAAVVVFYFMVITQQQANMPQYYTEY